jgi:hypothetical protein
VIAKARELRPQKPLTRVVASHHHFDHSGGVRGAVSEGLAVVAHRPTAAFAGLLASVAAARALGGIIPGAVGGGGRANLVAFLLVASTVRLSRCSPRTCRRAAQRKSTRPTRYVTNSTGRTSTPRRSAFKRRTVETSH